MTSCLDKVLKKQLNSAVRLGVKMIVSQVGFIGDSYVMLDRYSKHRRKVNEDIRTNH